MPNTECAAIAAGESIPDSAGRSLGAPLLANLINFVSERAQTFDGSPMDVPYAYAAWLYFAEMESQGLMKIENAKECEVKEELASHKAEALREEQAEATKAAAKSDLATPPPDLGGS